MSVSGGTTEEERGIYIDLKGFRDERPVVLGILIEDDFEQVVTDFEFGDAALAKQLRVRSFEDEMHVVAQRCASEDRRAFGFTADTLNTIDRFAPAARMASHFEDVRELALLWHDREGRRGSDRWNLADFLADIDQPLPGRWMAKHTTPRLRHVQTQLRSHGAYESITGTAKSKWTKLLQQSEVDTHGARSLALAASEALRA